MVFVIHSAVAPSIRDSSPPPPPRIVILSYMSTPPPQGTFYGNLGCAGKIVELSRFSILIVQNTYFRSKGPSTNHYAVGKTVSEFAMSMI